MKTCSKCAVEKPVSAFSRHKTSRDGIRSYCRDCALAYNRANPSITKRATTAWRKRNAERVAEQKRTWRLANPAKVAEHKRSHHERHREQIMARVERWRRNNPLQHRAHNQRRRAKERDPYTTAARIAARIAYYGERCRYCGAPWQALDHRIPLSRGGRHLPANLVPACKSCNSRKHAKTESEFLRLS